MARQKLASSPSAWCSYERFLLLQAGSPCLRDTPPPPLLTCALIFLSKDQCSVFTVQKPETGFASSLTLPHSAPSLGMSFPGSTQRCCRNKRLCNLDVFRVCLYPVVCPLAAFLRLPSWQPRPGATAPGTSRGHVPDLGGRPHAADSSKLACTPVGTPGEGDTLKQRSGAHRATRWTRGRGRWVKEHALLTASPESSCSSGVTWASLWKRSTEEKLFQHFSSKWLQVTAGLWQCLASLRHVGHWVGCFIRQKAKTWGSVGEVQLISLNNISDGPSTECKNNCS